MNECKDFLCRYYWSCINAECGGCSLIRHVEVRCSVCIYVNICIFRGKGRNYFFDDDGNEYYVDVDGHRHYTRDEG